MIDSRVLMVIRWVAGWGVMSRLVEVMRCYLFSSSLLLPTSWRTFLLLCFTFVCVTVNLNLATGVYRLQKAPPLSLIGAVCVFVSCCAGMCADLMLVCADRGRSVERPPVCPPVLSAVPGWVSVLSFGFPQCTSLASLCWCHHFSVSSAHTPPWPVQPKKKTHISEETKIAIARNQNSVFERCLF